MILDSKTPSGPLAQKWDKHKFDLKLVNPANKRKFDIIVVGSGLAGASAAALTRENLAARPQPYARQELVAASYASRTMIWSGLIIGSFVIFHLLHYTADVAAINGVPGKGHDFESLVDEKQRHDVYAMVLLGFRNPLVSGFYCLAMVLLCLHLGHGVSAMFQSLGFKSPVWAPRIDLFARGVSWAICLGYLSIPTSILIFRLGETYLQTRGYLP